MIDKKEASDFISFQKLLIFGCENTGKSTLTRRIEIDKFIQQFSSEEEVVYTRLHSYIEEYKNLSLNVYEIRVSDASAKDECYYSPFFIDCYCAILLFDLTDIKTFTILRIFYFSLCLNECLPCKFILVGNKKDEEKNIEVKESDIRKFIDNDEKLEYLEISTKTGDNFLDLLNKIYKNIYNDENSIANLITENQSLNPNKFFKEANVMNFILLGDSTVGKSSFFRRYFRNDYSESFLTTIGIDKEIKIIKVGNLFFKIFMWDTAGQDRFRSLPKKYYQNADGAFLIFDITNTTSFNNISKWMIDLRTHAKNKGVNSFLLGNKIDLPNREVSFNDALTLAKSLNMKYFEISCKMNMNIYEVVNKMILDIYMKIGNVKKKNFITLSNKNIKSKKNDTCCNQKNGLEQTNNKTKPKLK